MRNIIVISAIFVSIATVHSLYQIYANFVLAQSIEYNDGHQDRSRQYELEEGVGLARRATLVNSSNPLSWMLLSKAMRRAARVQTDPDVRLNLYCESLSALGNGLKLKPYDKGFLIYWADTRQILANYECPQPYTKGVASEVLNYAMKLSPNDPLAAYSAGIVYKWIGERSNSLAQFRRVLELSPELEPEKRDYIVRQIESGEDLLSVLPSRLSIVANWSRYFANDLPRYYAKFRTQFAKLQLAAIQSSRRELELGQIGEKLHALGIWELFDIPASSAVRRRLDVELAAVASSKILNLNGLIRSAAYLAKRGSFDTIPVVAGVTRYDPVPHRSNLSEWGTTERVNLDAPRQSVGFFLPEDSSSPTMIEFAMRIANAELDPKHYRLLVSDDNENWGEPKSEYRPYTVDLESFTMLVFEVHEISARYWKVHYINTSAEKGVGASLDYLLHVYGNYAS